MDENDAERAWVTRFEESAVPARVEPAGQQLADHAGRPYYPSPPGESDDPPNFDFRFYLHLVRKRWKLIAAIAAAILAVAWFWTLLVTPFYTSTVRIQVDREGKVVERGETSTNQFGDIEAMKTQYELLQSRNMAERVVAIANLAADATVAPDTSSLLASLFRGKRDEPDTPPPTANIGATVAGVLNGRVVKPVPGSRLIDISYSDPSPARAQKVAGAFGQAFINFNLDKRLEANAYAKSFLDDQTKQLKVRLQESEKAMLEFAEKEKIIASSPSGDKASISEANLQQANAAYSAALQERIKNEQLWRQVEKSTGVTLPQLLNNKIIDDLRAKRNEISREYKEKSATFQPGYPIMVDLRSRIAEIDHQIAVEVKTVKDSLKGAYEASLNQESELKKQLDNLKVDTLDLQKRSIQYNILRREVETTRTLYESLLQRYKEVDVAGGVGVNNVFIVDNAETPTTPSFPVKTKILAITLIGGLAAGFGVALLLDKIDDILHSVEQIETHSGLVPLGIIPITENYQGEINNPRSALSESYRSLCTTLQLTTTSGLPRSILITSAMPGEGKSSTSAAIAQHFAATGLKTLLIDADLRNASLHKKLGLQNFIGLSNYLTNSATITDSIAQTSVNHLYFMSSGPLPPNAGELLGSSRMRNLLEKASGAFDLVIVDAPPVMGLADAPLLTRSVATTLFAVAAGQTRIGPLKSALKRLKITRAHLIGVVVTKYNTNAAGYGYGYGYGYGGAGYGADGLTYGQIENKSAQNPEPARAGEQAIADNSNRDDERGNTEQKTSRPKWFRALKKVGKSRGQENVERDA